MQAMISTTIKTVIDYSLEYENDHSCNIQIVLSDYKTAWGLTVKITSDKNRMITFSNFFSFEDKGQRELFLVDIEDFIKNFSEIILEWFPENKESYLLSKEALETLKELSGDNPPVID